MPAPGRPRERRRPRLVVGQVGRCAARSSNSTMSGRSLRAAQASGVERYSSSLAEISAPASSRMPAHSTRAPRPAAAVASAEVVKERRALPVGQVGIHATREQQPQNLGFSSRYERHAVTTGGTRAPASSSRTTRSRLPSVAAAGEHAAATGVGALGIRRDPPHHFVVFVQPDQVVAVELAAVDRSSARSSRVFAAHVALPAEST